MTRLRTTEIDIPAQIRAQKEELRKRIERDRQSKRDFDFLVEKIGLTTLSVHSAISGAGNLSPMRFQRTFATRESNGGKRTRSQCEAAAFMV
jgi:hypothetical protein